MEKLTALLNYNEQLKGHVNRYQSPAGGDFLIYLLHSYHVSSMIMLYIKCMAEQKKYDEKTINEAAAKVKEYKTTLEGFIDKLYIMVKEREILNIQNMSTSLSKVIDMNRQFHNQFGINKVSILKNTAPAHGSTY